MKFYCICLLPTHFLEAPHGTNLLCLIQSWYIVYAWMVGKFWFLIVSNMAKVPSTAKKRHSFLHPIKALTTHEETLAIYNNGTLDTILTFHHDTNEYLHETKTLKLEQDCVNFNGIQLVCT